MLPFSGYVLSTQGIPVDDTVGSVGFVGGLDERVISSAVWQYGLTGTDDATHAIHVLRCLAAAVLGKSTVVGNAGDGYTVTFRDLDDTKDRITATTTGQGARTVVTLDAD